MRKFLSTTLVLIASAVLAVAAPGTVTKVSAGSFTVHWDVKEAVSKHGMAHAYSGTSREYTFTVSPSTTYTVNGAKGSFANIQKGVHVNVQHSGLVATHVDVVP
jgi:maltose-binding protein MalE